MREFNRYRTLALMFRDMKKISVSTVDLYYDIVALMFYASIVALWEVGYPLYDNNLLASRVE